jgi:soluble lytic murein transglycosylase-like protein
MSQTLVLPHPAQRLADFTFRALHASLLAVGVAVTLIAVTTLHTSELSATLRQWMVATLFTLEPADTEEGAATPPAATGLTGPLQIVAETIARRYRIAQPAVEDIVRMAETTARRARLDPLLVLAVIGVESRFNPYAESTFGAQGLMQIIGRFHTDKYAPTPDGFALLDPETNIRVGVLILQEYLRRTGDLDAALKLYGGETDSSGFGYADKVHAERERLQQALQRSRKG